MKKLALNEIRLKSFVTDNSKFEKITLQGGETIVKPRIDNTAPNATMCNLYHTQCVEPKYNFFYHAQTGPITC